MGSPAARPVVDQSTAERLRATADSDAPTAAAPPLLEADASPRRHPAGPGHADPEASLVGPTPPSRLTAVGNAGAPAPGPGPHLLSLARADPSQGLRPTSTRPEFLTISGHWGGSARGSAARRPRRNRQSRAADSDHRPLIGARTQPPRVRTSCRGGRHYSHGLAAVAPRLNRQSQSGRAARKGHVLTYSLYKTTPRRLPVYNPA